MKDDAEPLLFSVKPEPASGHVQEAPLADRMRPAALDQVIGQEKILGKGRLLRRMIEEDRLASIILWGPPGVGKTTIAQLIASSTHSNFVQFSAVLSGIKEVKAVMADAQRYRQARGERMVLFIDELHRFNKAQQDAFLPYVESGTIILVGATTENPSFEVIPALMSRTKVFVLEPLTVEDLVAVMRRALADEKKGLGRYRIEAETALLEMIANYASGDARSCLNTIELAVMMTVSGSGEKNAGGAPSHARLTEEVIKQALQRATLRYDKAGEEHFNLISAFIKSIRNSDADAAVYWLARMIESGEDPLYIARRIVHHASEDIGLADPQALNQAVAAMQAVHFIGLPEGRLALTQATIYLALAPKSNSVYTAYMAAQKDALETEAEPVPLHLRNAPTSLMKGLGYGKDYKYAHNYEEGKAEMECLPPKLKGRKYYKPPAHREESNQNG